MRTIAFSSSNRNSASARASSVLPTPVGPRKMNEPIGRFGSFSPLRARTTASATAVTASSWPMTRLCSSSSRCSSFSFSPFSSRDTGHAGPAAHHRGDVLLADLLLDQPAVPAGARPRPPRPSSLLLQLRQRAVLQLGRPVEVVLPLGPLDVQLRLLDLLADRLHLLHAPASRPASGPSGRRCRPSGRPAPSPAWRAGRGEAASVSFFSASRSISSCITRRLTSSSSVGMESISVRSLAAASSIRSMALSGRKRSVM